MLRGRRYWVVRRKVAADRWAEFDADSREIAIAPGLEDDLLLDSLIHECLHVCLPDLADGAVDAIATDIAAAAIRMGFSREED